MSFFNIRVFLINRFWWIRWSEFAFYICQQNNRLVAFLIWVNSDINLTYKCSYVALVRFDSVWFDYQNGANLQVVQHNSELATPNWQSSIFSLLTSKNWFALYRRCIQTLFNDSSFLCFNDCSSCLPFSSLTSVFRKLTWNIIHQPWHWRSPRRRRTSRCQTLHFKGIFVKCLCHHLLEIY